MATPSATAKRKCCQSSVIGHAASVAGHCLSLLVDGCADQPAADDRALHLGGALVDARGAHLTIEPLEQVAPLQPPRAVQLHGLVDHPLRGLGREELGHRGALGDLGGRARPRRTPWPRRAPAAAPPRSGSPSRPACARPTAAGSAGRRRPRGSAPSPVRRRGPPGPSRPRTRRRWAGTGRGCASPPRSRGRPRRARRPSVTRTPSKTRRPIACGASMSSALAGQPVGVAGAPRTR